MSFAENVSDDWRKSSFSNVNDCVEVSFSDDVVRVRNSQDRSRPFLAFGVAQWASFTAAVRSGEFRRMGGLRGSTGASEEF